MVGLKAWPAQARAHCRVLARFSCCDAAVACGLPWRQQICQLQWSSSSRVKPPLRSFPPLARSLSPTHTLFFCTAVTAAPRSLPAAPSRVFCWALPHPHSAPHPRPHSNQPRACPAVPSVVVVVSSCVSSSAPCVRVLSVVVSSCCSTSLSTSLSYFRQCALTRCAFFDSIAFRDPALSTASSSLLPPPHPPPRIFRLRAIKSSRTESKEGRQQANGHPTLGHSVGRALRAWAVISAGLVPRRYHSLLRPQEEIHVSLFPQEHQWSSGRIHR